MKQPRRSTELSDVKCGERRPCLCSQGDLGEEEP